MNKEIPKTYSPSEIEEKWYKYWLDNKFFEAKVNKEKKPYTVVIPPPNITGILTMGHVLNNSIQDVFVRWKRMKGFETCWVPGTDHAGIATQNVVEKSLAKEGKRQAFARQGEICRAGLEVARGIWWHNNQAVEKTRSLVRLDARAIHDGRRTFSCGAGSFCQAVPERL